MSKAKVQYNTALSFMDYAVVVNSIANEYFDENGEYVPYFGVLNAMKEFYNRCVTTTIEEVEHDVGEASKMFSIVQNAEFIEAFNNALVSDGVRFDFANAYNAALDMVEVKKGSLSKSIDDLFSIVKKELKPIEDMFSEDSLELFRSVSEQINNGKFNIDSLADAVVKSYKNTIDSSNALEETKE